MCAGLSKHGLQGQRFRWGDRLLLSAPLLVLRPALEAFHCQVQWPLGHLPSGPQGHLRSWLSSREKFEDWVVLCLRAAWMADEWGAGIVLDRGEEAGDQDPGSLTHSLLKQHREWDSLSLRGDPALGLTSF